jgi:hypothetical protein
MAHPLTPAEVDQLAEDAAAAVEPKPPEALASPLQELPALAYGARGAPVAKLVALLHVLGFSTNHVITQGAPPLLEESVLVDVRAAREQLHVPDGPEVAGVEGEVIGQATWGALYEAAAAKLESEQAASS